MPTKSERPGLAGALLALFFVATVCASAAAAGAPANGNGAAVETKDAKAEENDRGAHMLYDKAMETLAAKDTERGLKMLETLVEQYPGSAVRFKAWLALGKHDIDAGKIKSGLDYLKQVMVLKTADKEPEGESRDLYVEAVYYSGFGHFQMHEYDAACAQLRTITTNYPNTIWGNQAYYYIGMSHFNRGNWDKAIKDLSLVGTFVDHSSPAVEYVEAGRRFYVKIADADLPVITRQNRQVSVTVETTHGDKETIPCHPLAGKGDIYIGSIGSEVGTPKSGDGVLQVLGGDSLTIHYIDENTKDGHKDIVRESKVKVVSTGTLTYTLGSYQSVAEAAYLDQPLFVLLFDADKDVSDNADEVTVKLVARYKKPEGDDAGDAAKTADAPKAKGDDAAGGDEEDKWIVRDKVTLTLKELQDSKIAAKDPVHTGRFGGNVRVEAFKEGQTVDQNDQILTCAVNDEIVASYTDELHIGGSTPRDVVAKIRVVSDLDNAPHVTQRVVTDPVMDAKKRLVEGNAFLELGRIFKSMGLNQRASAKCDEGLLQIEPLIRNLAPIPVTLKEQAYKLKWELFVVKDDLTAALNTCSMFNQLFPDSPYADEALMGMGKIKYEGKNPTDSIGIFRRVLSLKNSQAKPEAAFMIAKATEDTKQGMSAALPFYKECAQKFPQSAFAGQALSKVVDYYIGENDFAQANDILDQIFQDYPDADFLDKMLFRSIRVSINTKNYVKAQEKCAQLINEYPASPEADKAKQLMTKLEEKIKRSDGEDKK